MIHHSHQVTVDQWLDFKLLDWGMAFLPELLIARQLRNRLSMMSFYVHQNNLRPNLGQ